MHRTKYPLRETKNKNTEKHKQRNVETKNKTNRNTVKQQNTKPKNNRKTKRQRKTKLHRETTKKQTSGIERREESKKHPELKIDAANKSPSFLIQQILSSLVSFNLN